MGRRLSPGHRRRISEGLKRRARQRREADAHFKALAEKVGKVAASQARVKWDQLCQAAQRSPRPRPGSKPVQGITSPGDIVDRIREQVDG